MSLYMAKWLVQNHTRPLARNLGRVVRKKANSCCICYSKKVSFWIMDALGVAHGIVILARLFCREHEKRWKEHEVLNYEKFNGVMLVEKRYHEPAGIWANMPWNEFTSFIEAHTDDDRYRTRLVETDSFESCLTKSSDLIFIGRIDEFLEANK